jgi:putative ABC transport system substrate-binding protein
LIQQSQTIPIVIPGSDDPVRFGWVKSLARPGGNITGFTFMELSMFGKMLEILKQIAPVTHVGIIFNPDNPNSATFIRTIESIASPAKVEPIVLPCRGLPISTVSSRNSQSNQTPAFSSCQI